MSTKDDQWRELGRQLEAHRVALHLSKRAAAGRAGISEGWWRNLERGAMRLAGSDQDVTVSAKPETVHAAAVAVEMDPNEALSIVGFEPIEAPRKKPAPADVITQLVASIGEEIRLIREEQQRLGALYERLAAPAAGARAASRPEVSAGPRAARSTQ